MRSPTPSTFILVHGAWSGGWCYARVATLLRSRGHVVFTPTLTGQGERAHLMIGAINLSTHIEDVLGVLRFERLDNVVLAGHSYGGMVITGVADRALEKIKALAYLDAFIPEDGQSLFDINIPANTQRFLASAGTLGGLAVPAPSAAYFGVNAADAATVDELATPFPIGCFTEKLRLSGAYRAVQRHLYVHGTVLPRKSPFRLFYERALAAGWSAHALKCGHHVMLDEPEKTAELLETIAQRDAAI
jgi:pimeloyl-ACP methyl ester carboxylesterase